MGGFWVLAITYLGLFALPLTLPRLVSLVRRNAHWPAFSWAAFTLFVVTALAAFMVNRSP